MENKEQDMPIDVGQCEVKQRVGNNFSPEKIIPHKLFDVQVKGELFEVWHRDEKHNTGTLNGSSYEDNMWVKYYYNAGEEITWIPWHDWDGVNRVCFEIKIKQDNRVKYKWDDWSIRGTGICEIICNARKVYEFYFGDISYAFACAQKMIMEMKEHPFEFKNPEKEIGRKIWYKRQKAVIDGLFLELGEIDVRKEDGTGFSMYEPWHNEEDKGHLESWEGEKTIRVDVFDKDIYWFRFEQGDCGLAGGKVGHQI